MTWMNWLLFRLYTTFDDWILFKGEFFKRFIRLKKKSQLSRKLLCVFFFAFWKNNEVREVLDLSLNFLQYDFCVNIRHYTEILYFLMIRVCCWHLHYFQTFYKYISPDHHYKSTVDGDQGVDFFYKFLNHVLDESSCRVVHGANIL